MIVIALISGLILGILFFGGLWFTVKKTLGAKYAGLWFAGSSILRTAMVLTGFYFIAQSGLTTLLMSVAGFVAARFLVLRITKRIEQKEIVLMKHHKS